MIQSDLFGMVKWPFQGVKWPPTRGWKGHFESPGRWWFQNIFFNPYLGKWSDLTNIFQVGWNHQLETDSALAPVSYSHKVTTWLPGFYWGCAQMMKKSNSSWIHSKNVSRCETDSGWKWSFLGQGLWNYSHDDPMNSRIGFMFNDQKWLSSFFSRVCFLCFVKIYIYIYYVLASWSYYQKGFEVSFFTQKKHSEITKKVCRFAGLPPCATTFEQLWFDTNCVQIVRCNDRLHVPVNVVFLCDA